MASGRERKKSDAAIEQGEGAVESSFDLFGCASDWDGIFDAPMGGDRLAGPVGACVGGVIADREDEVESGCIGLGELVP